MNRQETQRHLKRLILPALLSSLLLASCATIDSDVYGEEDVLDYVRPVCTDEEFELVSSEQVEDRGMSSSWHLRCSFPRLLSRCSIFSLYSSFPIFFVRSSFSNIMCLPPFFRIFSFIIHHSLVFYR